MNTEANLLIIINRLLASFPAGQSGTGDEVVDAYMIGLSGIPAGHIAQASARFLQGQVEGHNPAFAPSPSQLAGEARRLWYRRIDEDRRDASGQQQIESRPEPLDENEIERRKAFVAKAMSKLKRTPDAERDIEAEQRKARMAERTSADYLDHRPIEDRLGLHREEQL